jgi:archaellum component FlaC
MAGGKFVENFMDRLAGKVIGSQDIIRANAQAEAMEAERTRQEAEQYRAQLEELRAGEAERRKALDNVNEALAVLSKRIDENDTKIHDVGVQIYRNVQAVVEKGQAEELRQLQEVLDKLEGNTTDFSPLSRKLNRLDESIKELETKLETIHVAVETKNSAAIPLMVITMLLAAASLIFNILVHLGIV